jgi:carbon storage regulator
MLALTRKAGEKIVIGDDVVVTVVDIRGDNVKLAIEAPKKIKIYRGEIYDAIASENKQAAETIGLAELNKLRDVMVNGKKDTNNL